MTTYVLRRLLTFVPMLLAISVISFVIIQLPPGSFVEQRLMELEAQGASGSILEAQQLRARYGLDQPVWRQYLIWLWGIVSRGDFGEAFQYNRPVNEIIWSYLGYTVLISGVSFVFVYALAIPLGAYAALRKNRAGDSIISAVAFVGMSIPEFLIALVLLTLGVFVLDTTFIGLFSPEYEVAPWSWGKLLDLLSHLAIPALIVAVNGAAGLLRIMRGNMLEVLGQDYIRTARAKGLPRRTVVGKHALRMAVNPLISILGMSLPALVSGSTIISIVLNLPTAGLLLYDALRVQDMYLAGSLILLLSAMLLVGNLLADIALAAVDPRIRYD